MITARPLVQDDLEAVVALLHAYDRRWFGEPLLTVEDVASEWRAPAFDLAVDSEGWEDDGELVAFSTLGTRGGVEFAVRDDWTQTGLEDALLQRWEAEARRRGVPALHRHLPVGDTEGRAVLEAHGWAVERVGWLLALAPETPVEPRPLDAGYVVRPLAEADLRAVHTVVSDAFAHFTPVRRSYEDWRAGTVDRADVTLEHGRVVTWADEVVGACLVVDPAPGSDPAAAEIWVPQVAVAAGHRRRGLARELLVQVTLAARARGVPRVGLYTNDSTGALGLYERLGMVVRHTLVECGLEP